MEAEILVVLPWDRDDAERAALAAILAKAAGPLPEPWAGREGYTIDLYCDDLEL